jgi:hypothetical protein
MRPDKAALDEWLSVRIRDLRRTWGRLALRLEYEGVSTLRDLVLLTDEDWAAMNCPGLRERAGQLVSETGLRLGMRYRDGILTFGDEP